MPTMTDGETGKVDGPAGSSLREAMIKQRNLVEERETNSQSQLRWRDTIERQNRLADVCAETQTKRTMSMVVPNDIERVYEANGVLSARRESDSGGQDNVSCCSEDEKRYAPW